MKSSSFVTVAVLGLMLLAGAGGESFGLDCAVELDPGDGARHGVRRDRNGRGGVERIGVVAF